MSPSNTRTCVIQGSRSGEGEREDIFFFLFFLLPSHLPKRYDDDDFFSFIYLQWGISGQALLSMLEINRLFSSYFES